LALPEEMSEPDTTAHWELLLAKISSGQHCYDDFMLPLKQRLEYLLSEVKTMRAAFN
jgi:DNA topoisomerase-3